MDRKRETALQQETGRQSVIFRCKTTLVSYPCRHVDFNGESRQLKFFTALCPQMTAEVPQVLTLGL